MNDVSTTIEPGGAADAVRRLGDERRGSVRLVFRPVETIAHVSDPIWQDVSCLAVAGRSLFCTCDETASVERLTLDLANGTADDHASFALGTFFDLPAGPTGEMDIEGIAVADGYLWVAGSHGLKRGKPRRGRLEPMEEIAWDPNRAFLGRVPLVEGQDGLFFPVAEAPATGALPARTARMLPMRRKNPKTVLRKMLAKDPLIGPFVGLPCKENGFDVEGLAVKGETVLLGLRGPTLRGYAVIVRLELKEAKDGFLKPRKLADGRRYALHALDLGGQGIRDLAWDGERLLILTGATTALESLQTVAALPRLDPEREVFAADELETLVHLPPVRHHDHAEGIAVVRGAEGAKLIVTHDSPAPARVASGETFLDGDVFDLPDAA